MKIIYIWCIISLTGGKELKKRVKLSVLGFSFNQTQSGTYGLVLEEEKGLRRLVIVIGTPEAQSIAFKLNKAKPPRPLTHDLFQSLLSKLHIRLKEIFIYKYDSGVFYSRLIFEDAEKNEVTLNSRTSDAIAIALRTKSPIYTTEGIMEDLAVVFDESKIEEAEEVRQTSIENKENIEPVSDYSYFDDKELLVLLQDAIADEDYELASVLRDELDKRKKSLPKKDI